jgi:hypothetical protein
MINASYCSGTHWDPRAAVVHYEHHHCHGTHWNPRSGQVNDTLPAIAAPPIGTRMQQWLVWLVGWLMILPTTAAAPIGTRQDRW